VHHYLQRGFDHEKILNLSYMEQMFYMASMNLCIEEDVAKYKALGG